jgi:hypothetical protein
MKKGVSMKRFLKGACVGIAITFLMAIAGGAYAGDELSGKVLETMNSGGYTYALIAKGDKKIWVAVPETKIAKGQTVTFRPGAEMANFRSKTLNRTFDTIIFSAGVENSSSSAGPALSEGSKGAIVLPAEKVKVEKASGPNAYTVSEIFKKAAALDKKKVSVKGKVIKVSGGIMNMNWVHLQDGSGDSKKGNHDLVVTTQDMPAVGDIVTATGTIAKDKDFGSNYKYRVIMEKASIKK